MKRQTWRLLALFLLALPACGPRQDSLPVPEEEFISALIDVHLAEAAAQNLRGRTRDSILNLYYDQIFEIHGLDRVAFETTMEAMREDPARLEKLYNKVMQEMERRGLELER